MMRWRAWLLALVLLLVVGQPVLAQGGGGGRVVFGQDFALRSGESLDGDLVVFGGDVFLEQDSIVRGAVMALGGAVEVAGRVDGDVFSMGGDVHLAGTARILGSVVASGEVVQGPGAVVRGDVATGLRRGPVLPLGRRWRTPCLACVPIWPLGRGFGGVLISSAQTLLGSLVLIGLGLLVVLLVPAPTRVGAQTATAYPLQSIGVGLLTLVAAALLLPLLVITCIGIPVAVLAALALGVAALFGWIVAGLALGERLLVALRQATRSELVGVALGLVVLAMLSGVPCLGLLVTLVAGSWGLGAVVLTRFGTTPYVGTPPGVTPARLPPAGPGPSTPRETPAPPETPTSQP